MTRATAPDPRHLPLGRSSAIDRGVFDGWEWVDALTSSDRWVVPSSWGADGWDLGSWPLVSVAIGSAGDGFIVVEYVEGDITAQHAATAAEAFELVDELAVYWWRRDVARGYLTGRIVDLLDDDPNGDLRGPFSWDRLDDNDRKGVTP